MPILGNYIQACSLDVCARKKFNIVTARISEHLNKLDLLGKSQIWLKEVLYLKLGFSEAVSKHMHKGKPTDTGYNEYSMGFLNKSSPMV